MGKFERKADGKDNDKNGLIDDINGWNFLGGKDGQVMESTMREGDREYLRLKDKYADYIFDGKNYNKTYLSHEDILKGGTLEFKMGDRPSRWGTAPNARPE